MRVRGPVAPSKMRRLSAAAVAALEAGDIEALMAVEHAEFGSARMGPDDEPDDDDDDDDDDAGDSGTKRKKKSDDDSDSGADDDDDDDSDSELEKERKRKKAADRRAAAAEAELQKIRDKDKTDLERAQGEVETLTEQVETLQSEVNDLRMQNAFLTSNKHTWHSPDTALVLAEKQGYLEDVVDEDGVVDKKALGKALDRLAKENPYLVKSDKKTDPDDDDDRGPSGEPAGRRSDNGKDDKAKKDTLRKRFPVLNTR